MDNAVTTPPPLRRAWLRPARVWMALGAAIVAIVAVVDVTTIDPRVTVRWRAEIGPADRVTLERRYGLGNSEHIEGTGWRYQLRDRSRDNIRALVRDPAVDDTGYIDRDALTAPDAVVRVTIRPIPFPLSDRFDRPSQLLQLHQSLWLLLGGGVLLWAARASSERRKRNVTVATLLLVGVMAVAFPIDPSLVTMGEAREHAESRTNFERYFGGRVRFEKHLSQTMLLQVYLHLDPTDAAPPRGLCCPPSRLASSSAGRRSCSGTSAWPCWRRRRSCIVGGGNSGISR